jgi:uncharacterized membrane protein YfcA
MPAASSVLSPVEAIIFVTVVEIIGPLPNVPAALRTGRQREVGLMLAAAALAIPLGLWCLSRLDPAAFGWIISTVVLVLLLLLMGGWRYHGRLTTPLVGATGGLGGFMAGLVGIPGPPVIMLYMASTLPVSVIRANNMLYLVGIDLLLFPFLTIGGMMSWSVFVLGLIVSLPYIAANIVGAWLFNPAAAGLFRTIAYIVIAASAILGLPLWKG